MQSEIARTDQTSRGFIETARRAQIVESAIKTIAEVGYAQASLARIAKHAGISAGVISYYFNGKDDLIAEVVAHVYAVGEAFVHPRVELAASAREALRLFIEAGVGFIAAHPTYLTALMNIIRAGRSDGGDRFDPTIYEPRRQGLGDILAWGQATGEFRAFSTPVMAATVIEGLDTIPPALARDPKLDLGVYAAELAELFDRATRADVQETSR